MKALFVALAALSVISCAPAFPPDAPEAVVSTIYDPLVKSQGEAKTDLKSIPMTEDLLSEVWSSGFISDDEYCALACEHDLVCISQSRCESAGKPAKLENDAAGLCVDCSGFSGLKIAQTQDNSLALQRKIISATFNLSAGRTQSVYFHVLNGEGGWRVDNIVGPDRFNLRGITRKNMRPTHWRRTSPH